MLCATRLHVPRDQKKVRLANMQWEEKWKATMSEFGGDAKIPDLLRMSALSGIRPKDVKEQMRLHEIGENYEYFKTKVVSYTTNKTERKRGGQKEMHAPMEADGGAKARRTERDACADGGGRRTTSVAASWKMKSGKMWTRFGEDRRVTTAGRWDTSRRIVEGLQKERQAHRERWRHKQGNTTTQRSEDGVKHHDMVTSF